MVVTPWVRAHEGRKNDRLMVTGSRLICSPLGPGTGGVL